MCNSEGEILKINRYEIAYNASTKYGLSGSPIFLKNTTEVIGIHKQGSTSKNENYGSFIYPIINRYNNAIIYILKINMKVNMLMINLKEKENIYMKKMVNII